MPTEPIDTRRAALLAEIDAMIPRFQANAGILDRERRFPVEELAALRGAGALAAVVPERQGGLGLGTEPAGAEGLFEILRRIGRGNLAVGRIYEGHVNALALIARHGTPRQLDRAAEDAAAGHLFAIWNTEGEDGLRIAEDGPQAALRGAKLFCSAAGHATRAVVTAKDRGGAERLLLVALDRGQKTQPMDITMQGMRASLVGRVAFDGMAVPADALIGMPGDYLREPDFSGGAWRTSAVTLGGLEALLTEARRQLVERGREDDPHQKARIGHALIAGETARLWVRHAALIAERRGEAMPAEAIVAYVNLARIAVETATLDAMRLVQRALGLACLLQPNPVERLLRDLATYLRQPAPDEALTEAAAWYMSGGMAIGTAG